MCRKHAVLGVLAFFILAVLGVLVFAAGGIVARHHISPLVAIVDVAEGNVKALVKSLKGEAGNEEYFTSAYYHLKKTTYPTSNTGEGNNIGFAKLADGYLIGQRTGKLKFARLEEGNKVSVRPLAARVPTNKKEFLEDGADFNHRLKVQFGVKGLLIQPLDDDKLRLFATHQYWYRDRGCAVMRLSVLETSAEVLLDGDMSGQWYTVYETHPCLAMDNQVDHDGNDNMFLQSGGRLALLDENTLLMTVGGHFQESMHSENLVQDPNASYGKIIKIELRGEHLQDSRASMLTMGHRNPQGLYVDEYGNIWSTEHGPRGGDELNLIQAGSNYGWPYVSYGTDYEGVDWPEHLDWAGHEGYQKPVFAWLPSIGINNVIRLEDSGFPLWDGNLLIASLRAQALHRLILEDKRVVAWERIEMGSRVRDLMQTEEGRLLLLTDDGKLIFLETVDASNPAQMPAELRAAQLWVQCASCHSRVPGGGHSVGPNLYGVVGRDIASFDNYNYSPALGKLDGAWTPEKLDAFLRAPQQFAPGTAMAFSGLKSAKDRQLIIQFLQSQ